jgi:hypothetical protein
MLYAYVCKIVFYSCKGSYMWNEISLFMIILTFFPNAGAGNEIIPLENNINSFVYTSGGVNYLIWDDSTKKYSYDKFDLDGVIRWLVSKNVNFKYLKNLSYKVTINIEPKKNDNLVIGGCYFFDSANKPISIMRTLFFILKITMQLRIILIR